MQIWPEKPTKIVLRYIAALNRRDIETVKKLYSTDVRLIDSTGGWVEGREKAIAATNAFFEFEDSFRLEHEAISMRGQDVLVRGTTKARDPGLAGDTLWRARVKKGKLSHWQSYGSSTKIPLAKILLPEHAHGPNEQL